MTTPTNVQIIQQGGKPMFAVIPYDDYVRAFRISTSTPIRIPQDDSIPHEVVRLSFDHDWTAIRAWREYLGYTQADIANKLAISQSALAQIETSKRPRKATKQKIAMALGIGFEQLDF
jgi:DNA-binding XRE family transcriptional regulator